MKQRGFSILEVVIATTIMAIVAGGMFNLIHAQALSVGFLEDKLSKVDLKNNLSLNLANGDSCTNTFELMPVKAPQSSLKINELKDKNDDVFIKINDPALGVYNRLTLASMRLENIDVPVATSSSGMMRLKISPLRQGKGGGPQELEDVTVDLQVFTFNTPPVRIETCQVVGVGGRAPSGAPCAGGVKDGETTSSRSASGGHCHFVTTRHLCLNGNLVMLSSRSAPIEDRACNR